MAERLDKIVADTENCTRSQARTLIRRGEVAVGGQTVRDIARKTDPASEEISVSGRILAAGRCYIMMNKPAGVISATVSAGERTVLDLLPPQLQRRGLFPAGRLDKDTTGFMLITDDGPFAHEILSPRRHVEKEYEALLEHPADAADIEAFARGIRLGDGTEYAPAVLELDDARTTARIVIREGKYHQVRRMFQRHGATVTRLVRIRIGALPLDPALPPGGCRELTEEERELLLKTTEIKREPEAEDGGD